MRNCVMLRFLNALQLVQQNLEISRNDNKLFDVVIHRVVVHANVLGDGQLSGAVVVRQTLRNQECPCVKFLGKFSLK